MQIQFKSFTENSFFLCKWGNHFSNDGDFSSSPPMNKLMGLGSKLSQPDEHEVKCQLNMCYEATTGKMKRSWARDCIFHFLPFPFPISMVGKTSERFMKAEGSINAAWILNAELRSLLSSTASSIWRRLQTNEELKRGWTRKGINYLRALTPRATHRVRYKRSDWDFAWDSCCSPWLRKQRNAPEWIIQHSADSASNKRSNF